MSKCLLSINEMPHSQFGWGIIKVEWGLGQEHRLWHHGFKSHLSCDELWDLGPVINN